MCLMGLEVRVRCLGYRVRSTGLVRVWLMGIASSVRDEWHYLGIVSPGYAGILLACLSGDDLRKMDTHYMELSVH